MFTKKYDQFSTFNKKKSTWWTVKMMIEWIVNYFFLKCKFWECSCYKRTKAQLFKETCINRKKCCFNF